MSTAATTSGEEVSHSDNTSSNNNSQSEMALVGGAIGAGSNHRRPSGPYDTRPPPPPPPPPPIQQQPPPPPPPATGLVFNRGSTRVPILYNSTITAIVAHVTIRAGYRMADRPYAYQCERCGRRHRHIGDFHRHMRQLEGREGFRVVRAVPQMEMVWYGVDDAGYRYMGPLLRPGLQPLERRRR
ncbi:hypothetical protein H2204_014686 [Knufia peltigerae]|uniref:C2H2-type domain-containing protein n=1 Tax=Knufia peltigerae TaxID=1002370 RepID=A0AA39CLM8_9EURO|nr:hypothetical protein H2204_014686 [Knufia peltigerae]